MLTTFDCWLLAGVFLLIMVGVIAPPKDKPRC